MTTFKLKKLYQAQFANTAKPDFNLNGLIWLVKSSAHAIVIGLLAGVKVAHASYFYKINSDVCSSLITETTFRTFGSFFRHAFRNYGQLEEDFPLKYLSHF